MLSPNIKNVIVVYCESVLGFDDSTLTHKILFIYKVHDIIVIKSVLFRSEWLENFILGCNLER